MSTPKSTTSQSQGGAGKSDKKDNNGNITPPVSSETRNPGARETQDQNADVVTGAKEIPSEQNTSSTNAGNAGNQQTTSQPVYPRPTGTTTQRAVSPQEYQVDPNPSWPPPIFIRKTVVSPEERYYLEHRWWSQWAFFDKKAGENKRQYHRLQLMIGVGSVTVPVLVGIPPTTLDATAQTILYFATVIISLLVAISAALENIYQFGDNWRSYRNAAEELLQEKSIYDVRAGRYAGNVAPFTRFVERCEEIIAQQNGRWVQSQERQQQQAQQQAQEFIENYIEPEENKEQTPQQQTPPTALP